MTNEIIVALIGLGGSALGSVIGVLASSKLTQYRIGQLEKKVDKHNSLIERTYLLESRAAVMEEDIRLTGRRVETLEREVAQHG